eukprot:432347_1
MDVENFDCIQLNELSPQRSSPHSSDPLITDTSCQLTEWLRNNDLPDLVSIFENEQITLQTLIDLDKNNVLDQYLSALDTKIALTRKLILVTKLRKVNNIPEHSPQNNNNLRNCSIVSEIEEDSIGKLHDRNENISKLLKQLNNSYWMIKKQSTICQKEIESQFKSIIHKIENKQSEMINKIKIIEKQKLNEINDHIKHLQNEEIKCNITIKTFDQLFIENINPSKRKQKIKTVTNDILQNELLQIDKFPEQFTVTFNDNSVDTLLSSICFIESGHPLPIVSNIHTEAITTDTATIKWNAQLASIHKNIQSSAKLFVCLQCILDNDKDEKKEQTEHKNMKLIPFNKQQIIYHYTFEGLQKNSKYKININIYEQSNKSSNNKIKRKDFESISIAFNTLNVNGKDGILIVNSNETKTLQSDYEYEFGFVLIENGGILTVNNWNSNTQKGGILKIKSLTNFIIAKNGIIDLNGKGYKGGNKYYTGESYKKPSIKQGQYNLGGGGGGGIDSYGGGGGYGTNGHSNTHPLRKDNSKNGGIIYGDKELNILHMGSGGGGYSLTGGSNGGGALKIECKGKFENYGKIFVNGMNCVNYGDGAGSGGSVFIICDMFYMNINDPDGCVINACGGNNRYELGGKGGDGRIRIKCVKTGNQIINKYVCTKQIIPVP